jgi:hypothetical protein
MIEGPDRPSVNPPTRGADAVNVLETSAPDAALSQGRASRTQAVHPTLFQRAKRGIKRLARFIHALLTEPP